MLQLNSSQGITSNSSQFNNSDCKIFLKSKIMCSHYFLTKMVYKVALTLHENLKIDYNIAQYHESMFGACFNGQTKA